MALIELIGVARHYQHGDIDVPALDGINLSIEAGEYVAIVGQSGSGKSTLMNVLGCLDNPTHGSFHIGGQDASQLGADELAALRRERFGFIFQRYHLLPHLDARGNAALPAVYAGLGNNARSKRAEALLTRLGLAERLHHRPNALSGGQQQRVSIARALMNGGQIILADEPTGALDSASGAEMLRLLGELNQKGHTIILVTHDPSVAANARRVIELKDGRVLKDSGTPAGHSLPADAPAELAGTEQSSGLRRLQVQWREAILTAWLALRGNRLRTALSMLGISIGIASVVSILALTDAARGSIEKDVRGFLSGRIPVWRGNSNLPPGAVARSFRPSELDAIRALPGVKAVNVVREMELTARHRARDVGVTAVGADAQSLAARKLKLVEGRYFNELDQVSRTQTVVIDGKARKALFKPGQPALGQTLLLSPMAAAGPATAEVPGQPAAAGAALPMTVIGVVEPDGGGISLNFSGGQVLLPLSTFTRKLDPRLDTDSFNVMLDFSLPPAQVREQVIHRLKALHGVEDFDSWNADEEFQKIQNVTAAMAALFAGVGAIALLVGGVGVMNIMLVSVSERTREIGIRMAVGARQSDVRLQFLIEAVVLCCLGGLVGVALSWLGAQGINAVQAKLEVRVSWTALAVAFAVSSAVGLLFGTLPARRAAALSPVDALARE
ncbi:ATP-binding cassette domain-containing protein [Paucibacter sp. B2R-40]|uniref:ATP-binding cassette domain-containing protein n=1 Tax=Paucibacter sp. B2R-40 TaxID=2893554 RepID=UPI0021E3A85A|nr:ATP-binding cassette domain-containing protein [Paucibacter sp. B2R-40]MCV2353080.1 ATP-binding cassette domain-containing protein [Paucibacter sp. B2R-40]